MSAPIHIHGPLVFRLVAWLFPLRDRLPEDVTLDDLKGKYLKWERINALEYLVAAIAATRFAHPILTRYAASLDVGPGAVFTLRTNDAFWYFPAILIGCAAAGFLVHILNRVMLPGGGREFRTFSNVSGGLDVVRMYRGFAILAAAFGLILAYFAAQSGVILRENDMVIHRLWSLHSETHSYTEITAIKDVIDPQSGQSDFEIDFQRGEPWTTRIEVVFFDDAQRAFLIERSGRMIQQVNRE